MDLIRSEATFFCPHSVRVALNDGGSRTLRGSDVVLNLGTEPLLAPIDGLGRLRGADGQLAAAPRVDA